MSGRLSQDDIENLLTVCGTVPTYWNAHGDMMVCCPVHNEVNPSCGVSSEKQIFHCFSCHEAGDFSWMLFKSQPDQFPSYRIAKEFIEKEYDVKFEVSERSHSILRYEDGKFKFKHQNRSKSIPMYKLAPYMSGKETYNYFFRRGFSKETMQKYKIGRDLVNKTVTIPVFLEDGELAGIIGRFISKDRKKNERYKIYDNFNRGNVLYPVDKFEENGSIILVEGQFDAIRMHELGYTNTLAKMGVSLTRVQARWIAEHCDTLIDLADNDERGIEAVFKDKEILDNRVRVLGVEYPDHGKDVCEWKADDIRYMIENAGSRRRLKRYE